MNTTTNHAPATGVAMPSRLDPQGVPFPDSDASVRRREGLRALLTLYRITPRALAHLTGLPSANAIYNFLHGRSAALSLATIEAILIAFPEFTFEELTGRPRRRQTTAGTPPV